MREPASAIILVHTDVAARPTSSTAVLHVGPSSAVRLSGRLTHLRRTSTSRQQPAPVRRSSPVLSRKAASVPKGLHASSEALGSSPLSGADESPEGKLREYRAKTRDRAFTAAMAAARVRDVDADERLVWTRFSKLVRRRLNMHRTHLPAVALRECYEQSATRDRQGVKASTLNDVFRWALATSSRHAPQGQPGGLEAAFRHYDADGLGTLDPFEFFRLVEDCGHGDNANLLLAELDADQSGSLSYSEVMISIKGAVPASSVARRFLLTLAFEGHALRKPGAGTVDWQRWPAVLRIDRRAAEEASLEGSSPLQRAQALKRAAESARRALQTQLFAQNLGVSALYHALSHSHHDARALAAARRPAKWGGVGYKAATWELSKTDFVYGMLKLGFPPDYPEVLDECFESVDAERLGRWRFSEVYGWVHGLMGSFGRVKLARSEVSFHWGLGRARGPDDVLAGKDEYLRLIARSWSTAALREEINGMLRRAALTAVDLFYARTRATHTDVSACAVLGAPLERLHRACAISHCVCATATQAWDEQHDGSLSKKEFMAMMRRLVGDPQLWNDESKRIPPLVEHVYSTVAGDDASIDVIEFEEWLGAGDETAASEDSDYDDDERAAVAAAVVDGKQGKAEAAAGGATAAAAPMDKAAAALARLSSPTALRGVDAQRASYAALQRLLLGKKGGCGGGPMRSRTPSSAGRLTPSASMGETSTAPSRSPSPPGSEKQAAERLLLEPRRSPTRARPFRPSHLLPSTRDAAGEILGALAYSRAGEILRSNACSNVINRQQL